MGNKESYDLNIDRNDEDFDNRYKFHPSLPAAEDWYPPPRPARTRKSQVFNRELLADAVERVNDVEDSALDDYDELAKKLTEQCQNDMEKACAIVVFVATHCLQSNDRDKTRVRRETPRAYIQSIKRGFGRYSYFFTLLCRKAGMACVLVPGIARTAQYCTGDTDLSKLRNVWLALLVAGDWRLVHPLWLFQTEPNGQIKFPDRPEDDPLCLLNHYWFLTDAHEFISFCFPDESKWQLLPREMPANAFVQQLHISETFHTMGLRIMNHTRCHIVTSSGFSEITMQVSEEVAPTFTVSYELSRCFTSEKVDETTTHCLAMIKDLPLVKFKLRSPFAENLLIKIFGSYEENPKKLDHLCAFRIDCSKAIKVFMPFPESPYYGWGPGFETKRCGVKALTHKAGLFTVTSSHPIAMKFKLRQYVELVVDFVEDYGVGEPTCAQRGKDATVHVKLPQVNKEYGLVIYAKNSQTGFVCNAVNYIIRREVNNTKK